MRLLIFILATVAWAAPPTISVPPSTQYATKYTAMVKWRTTDAPGPTSTLATPCSLPQETSPPPGENGTCNVQPGDGSKFPLGSVVKIGNEHLKVVAQSTDTLTLNRDFDLDIERVYEGTLTSITTDGPGTTCTVTTPDDNYYTVGQLIYVQNQQVSIGTPPFTVASTPTTKTFTFACTGPSSATLNNASVEVYKWGEAHTTGDTITRVDPPSQVCYYTGTFSSWTTILPPTTASFPQSNNHWVYLFGLTPGATYHYKVQSMTPGGAASTCASAGADTVESSTLTFTTTAASPGDQVPTAPSNNGRTWDFTDSATFTRDELAANCADAQSKMDTDAGLDGSLNYRVRIPASANWSCNLLCRRKTGSNPTGTGKLVLEADTSVLALLPPQGIRINSAWHGPSMPTLYTSTSDFPVIQIAPSASYWIIRGLHITTDPNMAAGDYLQQFNIANSFSSPGSSVNTTDTDVDATKQPNHIAFDQIWADCPAWNGVCSGMRLHGTYMAVMDSLVNSFGYPIDAGGIQIDGINSQYLYTHNNWVSAPMTGYYQSDNSLNGQDSIVDRNYFYKPVTFNGKSGDFIQAAVQGVASITHGSTTTITTTNANDIGNLLSSPNPPITIQGATGGDAAFNSVRWNVRDGSLALNCVAGACTATTSSPHGLSTGQQVYGGGGYTGACGDFVGFRSSSTATVTGPTTFTFTLGSGTFSTTSGTPCQMSDLVVWAPVWIATRTGTKTFTIPVNSTGFAAGGGTVTVGYPRVVVLKNGFEFKTGERALITGNILNGSFGNGQQPGQAFTMTIHGSDHYWGWPQVQQNCFECPQTIQDVDIQKNWTTNTCILLEELGFSYDGPTSTLSRVRVQGNFGSNISAINNAGGVCPATMLYASVGYGDLTLDHNTVHTQTAGVNDQSPSEVSPPSTIGVNGKLYYTNNVVYDAYSDGSSSCTFAGMLAGLNTNGCFPSFNDWVWSNNVLYGDNSQFSYGDPWNFARQYASGVTTGSLASYQANFWPNDQSGVGFAGQITLNACTNTAPIVCTSTSPHGLTSNDGYIRVEGAAGNTGANGLWPIGPVTSTTVTLAGSIGNGTLSGTASAMAWSGAGATPANSALGISSVYRAGTSYAAPGGPPSYVGAGQGQATDSTDVGADMSALRVAIGDLTLTSVTPSNTSAVFAYTAYAGSGDQGIIDVSSDGWATSSRTTDSNTGTSRSTTVTGLTSATTYAYRLMLPSMSLSGTFTTSGVAPDCSDLVLAPSTHSSPSGGDSFTLSATVTDQTCAWVASSSQGWLTIASGGSGIGNGTIHLTAAANLGGSRSATVSLDVSSSTSAISQASAPPPLTTIDGNVTFGGNVQPIK